MDRSDGVFGVRINKASNIPSSKSTSLGVRPLKPPTLVVLVIIPKINSPSMVPSSHWIFI